MKNIYRTVFVVGALTAFSATACRERTPAVPSDQGEVVQVPEQAPEVPVEYYTVKNGDYLSRIAYQELGLRGRGAIYNKVKEIQRLNPEILTSDRDTHLVDASGNYVPGKDGLVDLIHPKERLRLD